VVPGQIAPRHPHVDMVGQVPAGVVGHEPEPGEPALADVVGGGPTVRAGLEAAVLGDGPEPVDHAPLRHPRQPPQQGVDPPVPGGRPQHGPQEDLDADDRQRRAPEGRVPEGPEERGEVLPSRDTDGVPYEAARQRPAVTRVPAVEGQVRLVRPELLPVVGEVAAPVQADRRPRGIGHQPGADPVVDALVREEQLVGRLVHEDGEPGVHGPHEQEGHQVRPPPVDPHRSADDERHPQPHRGHGHGVAGVADAAEVGTQLGARLAVLQQSLRGEDIGTGGLVGHHGGRHTATLQIYANWINHVTPWPRGRRRCRVGAPAGCRR